MSLDARGAALRRALTPAPLHYRGFRRWSAGAGALWRCASVGRTPNRRRRRRRFGVCPTEALLHRAPAPARVRVQRRETPFFFRRTESISDRRRDWRSQRTGYTLRTPKRMSHLSSPHLLSVCLSVCLSACYFNPPCALTNRSVCASVSLFTFSHLSSAFFQRHFPK